MTWFTQSYGCGRGRIPRRAMPFFPARRTKPHRTASADHLHQLAQKSFQKNCKRLFYITIRRLDGSTPCSLCALWFSVLNSIPDLARASGSYEDLARPKKCENRFSIRVYPWLSVVHALGIPSIDSWWQRSGQFQRCPDASACKSTKSAGGRGVFCPGLSGFVRTVTNINALRFVPGHPCLCQCPS